MLQVSDNPATYETLGKKPERYVECSSSTEAEFASPDELRGKMKDLEEKKQPDIPE